MGRRTHRALTLSGLPITVRPGGTLVRAWEGTTEPTGVLYAPLRNGGSFLAPLRNGKSSLASELKASEHMAPDANDTTLTVAGGTYSGGAIGIDVDGATANVSGATISTNGTGVYIHNSGTGTFTHNCIIGNTSYGMNNTTGVTVNGTLNWWGNASGPTSTGNPTGTGDAVVGLVTFNPWITDGCHGTAINPILSVTTTDALICTGEKTTVNIDLAYVLGLYGYQFEVSYDRRGQRDRRLRQHSFDTTTDATRSRPAGVPTAPPRGKLCKFAVANLIPDTAVSGGWVGPDRPHRRDDARRLRRADDDQQRHAERHQRRGLAPQLGCAAAHHRLRQGDRQRLRDAARSDGIAWHRGRRPGDHDRASPRQLQPCPAVHFNPANGFYSIVVPYMPG